MILEGPIHPAAPADPMREMTRALVEELRNEEQREMPVTDEFEPGVYIRTIFMPADTFVIGHVHKTRHINRVLTGRARVMMGGESYDIVAPCEFWSEAGVQKVLYIQEDMRWQTIHDNPDDCRDVPLLEERLVELDEETLLRKGNMTLDSLRLSVNKNLTQTTPCLSQSSE